MSIIKIIYLGSRGFDFKGGIESHLNNLLSGIKKKDKIEPLVLIPYYNQISKTPYKQHGIFTLRIKGIEKFLLAINSIFFIIRSKPDIVHIHGLNSSLIIPFLRIFGIPIVFTCHSRDWLHPEWPKYLKLLIKINFLLARQFSHRIIYVSKKTYESYPSKFSYFLENEINNIDLDSLNIKNDKPKKLIQKLNITSMEYILFVGRITPVKGIETLIKAFKKIKSNYPLIIVGEKQDKKYFNYLREISEKADVRFIGKLDYELVKILYFNSKLVVIPSLHEESPYVIKEAIACKANILCSNIDAFKLISEQDCMINIFKKDDDYNLASEINRLIDNLEKKNLKLNKKELSTNSNFEKWIKTHLSIYKDLLN